METKPKIKPKKKDYSPFIAGGIALIGAILCYVIWKRFFHKPVDPLTQPGQVVIAVKGGDTELKSFVDGERNRLNQQLNSTLNGPIFNGTYESLLLERLGKMAWNFGPCVVPTVRDADPTECQDHGPGIVGGIGWERFPTDETAAVMDEIRIAARKSLNDIRETLIKSYPSQI